MKCRTCGTTLTAGALLCGECGTSAIAPRPTLGDTERHDRRALLEAMAREASASAPAHAAPAHVSSKPAAPHAHGVPAHAASAPAHAAPSAPPEAPSPADPAAVSRSGPLFSLVFSTGESIRVSGSGLVGRNPAAGEGESFEYLVQIVDPERSVSKTHFEFGVDGDRLWIADRGSANGTRLGLDLVDPIDLVPGERMRVPRGTRIGIGDQYLDVH
ncbi:FHA domain-containing protein [Herbiconiux sp. CPCC 205763]|uniref:FHA domain-containing protein n=1 Tax=Herbiconiux aconitum TaxID=2970913 RepID=A0ABT2GUM9_9MICO|nr:FHA domain-containing protein [Herbiconiux aconitum]MCS5719888.1 FHA domain-containing protein [Herbiconiux aconitum]